MAWIIFAAFVSIIAASRFIYPFERIANGVHAVRRLARILGLRDSSSRFLRWWEQRRFMHGAKRGLLIDGHGKRLSEHDSFQHLALISPTGGGKTTSYIVPNLLTLDNCSIVVTDPSGELYNATSGYLARKGFTLRVLNLQEPSKGFGYNPVAKANSFAEIDKLANILIRSSNPVTRPGDDVWYSQPAALISIFLRCLKNTGHSEWQNLHNVLHLIQNWDCSSENRRSLVRDFVACYALEDQAILNQFKGFVAGNPKMVASFITMATDALKLLNNPEIAAMMSRDEFDFHALRREKTVVFLVVPETDANLYRFILNTFWSQFFDAQKESRYKSEGYPVYCLMDEFGHSRIPDFATISTTIRKYHVSLSIILQSVAQLREQYGPNDANTILSGGMRSKLFYSGLDLETSQMVEQMLGRKRVALQSGLGHREEALLGADRIRRLWSDEAIYVLSNEEPTLLRTTPFFRNPKLKRRTRLPAEPLPSSRRTSDLAYVPLAESSVQSASGNWSPFNP
tara:strand:+ start:2628 stop:4163 length:1536 start_codon:yes stop_codon:yes gene_type:complete